MFIGCGERGNEMTDVLLSFPELQDPRSGRPLMERTILVANTSNMPVAAREASIYTGITLAEYYRDMGYDVALMADSTSRWRKRFARFRDGLRNARRRRLPAYLGHASRNFMSRRSVLSFWDRNKRIGALSAIGAVSPPGGDLSEPGDPGNLAYRESVSGGWTTGWLARKHFPAIDWLASYSLYAERMDDYFRSKVSSDFPTCGTRPWLFCSKNLN